MKWSNEESKRCLLWSTFRVCAWKDWRKPWQVSNGIIGSRAEIGDLKLLSMKQVNLPPCFPRCGMFYVLTLQRISYAIENPLLCQRLLLHSYQKWKITGQNKCWLVTKYDPSLMRRWLIRGLKVHSELFKFRCVFIICSSWLQIQRSQVRFPALPDFLRSSGSWTWSIQPREDNWGATWMIK
jgi:hypothetical protein